MTTFLITTLFLVSIWILSFSLTFSLIMHLLTARARVLERLKRKQEAAGGNLQKTSPDARTSKLTWIAGENHEAVDPVESPILYNDQGKPWQKLQGRWGRS